MRELEFVAITTKATLTFAIQAGVRAQQAELSNAKMLLNTYNEGHNNYSEHVHVSIHLVHTVVVPYRPMLSTTCTYINLFYHPQ